ncbi:hypothetical protein [Amycolatopsis sp. NPDC054798]
MIAISLLILAGAALLLLAAGCALVLTVRAIRGERGGHASTDIAKRQEQDLLAAHNLRRRALDPEATLVLDFATLLKLDPHYWDVTNTSSEPF